MTLVEVCPEDVGGAAAAGAEAIEVREVHLRAPGTVVPAGISTGYDAGARSVTSAEVLPQVTAALGR